MKHLRFLLIFVRSVKCFSLTTPSKIRIHNFSWRIIENFNVVWCTASLKFYLNYKSVIMINIISADKCMIWVKDYIHYKVNIRIVLFNKTWNIFIYFIKITFFCLIEVNKIIVNPSIRARYSSRISLIPTFFGWFSIFSSVSWGKYVFFLTHYHLF